MGVVRLLLSLLVVGSHVGGLGDSPAGGTAVASFFAISGFLMARTISENYPGTGFTRFYTNRVIRLVPPLAAVIGATSLLLWVRDSQGFQLTLGSPERYMPLEFPSSLSTLVEWNPGGYPTYLNPQFHLVPQAWSLLVEAVFYVVAPVGVWLLGRRLGWVVWIAMAASFVLCLASARIQTDWMRSPLATIWMFLLGAQCYFLARRSPRAESVRLAAGWLAPFPPAMVILMGLGLVGLPMNLNFIMAPWLVAAWLVLGQWHSRRSGRIDQALGNLSYGVFLGHFLGTLLALWFAEAVYRWTGVFAVLGTPDDVRFHVANYTCAVLMGALIYSGVERPLDALRAIVRHRSGRAPKVAVEHAASAG